MKRCFIVFFTVAFLFFIPVTAFAADDGKQGEMYSEQYDNSGLDKLKDTVPENVNNAVDSLEIDLSDPETFLSLKPDKLIKTFLGFFNGGLITPLKITAIIIGIMMIIAAVSGLSENGQYGFPPAMLAGVISVVIILKPMFDTASGSAETVKTVTVFMAAFVPVLATILSSMGRVATAGSASVLLLGACEVISQAVAYGFIPAMGGCICLGICGSVSPVEGLNGLCESIKNFFNKAFTVVLTAFLGILSVQTVITSTGEGMGLKTTKVLISTGVPVMGAAISEAFGAAGKCLELLSSTAGIYAVLVVILLILPCVAQLICWRLCLWLCSGSSQALGMKQLASLFKSLDYCLAIILGALLFIALLFIISLTIIVKAGAV